MRSGSADRNARSGPKEFPMPLSFPRGIRVGGSALPDGVMMLTPLAVAIAREGADGTLSIHSFALPERKPNPIENIPFIRILPKLVGQMRFVVQGWKPKEGQKVSPQLVVAALIVGITSGILNFAFASLPT